MVDHELVNPFKQTLESFDRTSGNFRHLGFDWILHFSPPHSELSVAALEFSFERHTSTLASTLLTFLSLDIYP